MKLSSFARNAIVLGLLSAVGPFAIDMYLPALPTIAADLQASTAATQMTLMAFFVAFGVCQIVYGPVSDMVGRKPPLYFGLAVFLLGSIGCGAGADIGWLIAFRFAAGDRRLLGDGDSARDHSRPAHRRRGDAADVARHAGLQRLADPGAARRQRADRAVRLARGVRRGDHRRGDRRSFSSPPFLPETRPPEERISVSVGSVLGGFGQLLRHGRFLGLTFIGGLGMASFFVVSGEFVLHLHRPFRPDADAIQPRLLGQRDRLHRRLAIRRRARRALRHGPRGPRRCLALCVLRADPVRRHARRASTASPLLMALLFCAFACLGLVIPSTMVLSLEDHGPIAGMASALGGTLQMVAGGVDDRHRQLLLRRNRAADGRRHHALRDRRADRGAGDVGPSRICAASGRIDVAAPPRTRMARRYFTYWRQLCASLKPRISRAFRFDSGASNSPSGRVIGTPGQ